MSTRAIILTIGLWTSLAGILIGPVVRFLPATRPVPFLLACALLAFAACVRHRVALQERMWTVDYLRYFLPEFFLLLITMRIVASVSFQSVSTTQLWQWFYDPVQLIDLPFVVCIIVGLVLSWLTHDILQYIHELQPKSFDAAGTAGAVHHTVLSADRQNALAALNRHFIGYGCLGLLAIGLESVNIDRVFAPGRSVAALTVGSAISYFLFGFLLHSYARYLTMQARWMSDGATVDHRVSQQWNRIGTALICCVALGVWLLPRSYGLSLLDTIRSLFGIVGFVFAALGYLVIWLFTALTFIPAWLLSLITVNGGQTPPTLPPLDIPPPPPVTREPQFLPALVFWVCMALLAIYTLVLIGQRYPGVFKALTRLTAVRWLITFFRTWWGSTRQWVTYAGQRLAQQRAARTIQIASTRGARFRNRSPGERIRRYYGALLQAGAQQGMGRRESQTPREYQQQLTELLPDERTSLVTMTDAFSDVQYGPRDADEAQARTIAGVWRRLRARFRG